MKAKIIPYIVPILSVALSVVLVVFIVIPKYKSIKSLRKERESVKVRLSQLQTKTEKLSKLFSSLETMRSHDALLTKALPDGEEVPTLMNQVQRIVEDSSVEIKNMQFSRGGSGQKVKGQLARGVLLQVSVVGNFSTIQNFLKNVENASRVLDISDISFSSKGEDLITNIQIRSYYYIPEEVKSIDEPVKMNLNDPKFGKLIEEVKEFKYYETTVDIESGVGKEDPFRK